MLSPNLDHRITYRPQPSVLRAQRGECCLCVQAAFLPANAVSEFNREPLDLGLKLFVPLDPFRLNLSEPLLLACDLCLKFRLPVNPRRRVFVSHR